MSAVLERDTVADVHDAAAAKAKAAAETARLQKRFYAIELRAQQTLAERARHQREVTTALLEDSAMPKALPPQPVEPSDALRIIKAELKAAEAVLVEAVGDHRTAICRHAEHRRGEALATYREALASFTTALRALAAHDRIVVRAGLPAAIPSIFHSRLSIPALPGDEQVSPGLSVDGRGFFSRPELDEYERQARQFIEAECGPLPF